MQLYITLANRAGWFDDWFDFADFVKQENLAGRDVTIKAWAYLPTEGTPPTN